MKKAVIYARYSSERQTEQSIEGQLSVCKKYAQDNDMMVMDIYIDRAMTGRNDDRPDFRRMLADSAAREWQYVLVYKGDRFARNRIESAINKKTLKDNGVKLVSCTENIPDTPEGIILESLLEGMAEYYSAELAQKVRRGMRESRKKGQSTGGYHLYGYDVVKKKYVINEPEAEIVQKIFEDYANGMIVKDIIADLSARGLKSKYGKPFSQNMIYRMLRMEKYIGIIRCNGEVFAGMIPRIVPQSTWDAVQRINEQNKHAPAARKSKEKYLLAGKIFCGDCGAPMTGESGTSKTGSVYLYYKCAAKKRRLHDCKMKVYRKDEVENKVFSVCYEVLTGEMLRDIIDIAYRLRQEDIQSDTTIVILKKELAEKEKTLANILKAIERGIFNDITSNRMKELEQEISILRGRISREMARRGAMIPKEVYTEFMEKILQSKLDDETFRQEVFDLLIKRVVLFRDNRMLITFNFYPDHEGGGSGKKREAPISAEELQAVESEYSAIAAGKSSTSLLLPPPNRNNPNYFVFVGRDFWGVWVMTVTKR